MTSATTAASETESRPLFSGDLENPRIFGRVISNGASLLVLMLLTLGLRIGPLLRDLPICDDGYYYLAVADAYMHGDYSPMLHYLNVNLYPVIIGSIATLGPGLVMTAHGWGLLVSTLTVLPLYGWLRRQYHRTAAILGCIIYAVHPELIELAAEPLRDPTFWCLAVTALYLLHRAATERTLPLYAAAGVAFSLAVHTRTEGWLLVLPAAGWTLAGGRESLKNWMRVALGSATAAAMVPLFLVLFNMTALAGHDRWEWGRLEHFRLATNWVGLTTDRPPGASTILPTNPNPTEPVRVITLEPAHAAIAVLPGISSNTLLPGAQHQPLSSSTAIAAESGPARSVATPDWKSISPTLAARLANPVEHRQSTYDFFDSLAQTVKPIPLLLMLVGVISKWERLLKIDYALLMVFVGAIWLAVWIRLQSLGEINGRYFLFGFFPAAGAAGVGVIWVHQNVVRLHTVLGLTRPLRIRMAAAAFGLLAAGHAVDGMTADHPSRLREEQLGRALAAQLGPNCPTLTMRAASRVGYYAHGALPVMMLDTTPLSELLARHHPQCVVLEHRISPPAGCEQLARDLLHRGYEPFRFSGLPGEDRFLVLIRTKDHPISPAGQTAQQNEGSSRR